MKLPLLVSISLKYLFRYRRRYVLLFLALSFGFGIVTLLTAVKDAMYENVYNSAQDHYAGDIIVSGSSPSVSLSSYLDAEKSAAVFRALEESGVRYSRTVRRAIFGDRGLLYYNGEAVRLKYITGVDMEQEAVFFDRLNYREKPEFWNDDSALVSAPVAEALHLRTGDRVTLEIETRRGQKNTAFFTVAGIVNDATIFGYYKVYVPRNTLQKLLLLEDDECGVIGIYLENRNNAEKDRLRLQTILEKLVPLGPVVHNRDELQLAMNEWAGQEPVFVITIPVYLSEVADLLGAIEIVARFLYAMMLVIILMSALVTYRLVLQERRKELGTMRAIGFYGADLRFVLVFETLALALLSLAAGILLALLLQKAVTFIPFSWFPSFEIFLAEGKLAARYRADTMASNIAAVFAALLLAVSAPVWRASRENLPAMLSGG